MTLPSAGWYPDPEDSTRSRWWDGLAWTDNRSGFQAPEVPAGYSMNATALSTPGGTPWNTVWIWLVVFLPFIPSIGIFTIDWSSMFNFSALADGTPGGVAASELAMVSAFISPGYLFTVFGGFIAYGLSVWFAYLDWRELGRRRVPRPFHWAWAFISYSVYPIGRSVVVRRRTGRGISPMWVSIALIVASFISGIVFSIYIMSTMFAELSQYSAYLSS